MKSGMRAILTATALAAGPPASAETLPGWFVIRNSPSAPTCVQVDNPATTLQRLRAQGYSPETTDTDRDRNTGRVLGTLIRWSVDGVGYHMQLYRTRDLCRSWLFVQAHADERYR